LWNTKYSSIPNRFSFCTCAFEDYVVRLVIEIHTAEPSVTDPGPFEVDIAIAKLKRYKSPGSDQILAELIKQEVKYYVLRSIS
jgi:hypothetical protein